MTSTQKLKATPDSWRDPSLPSEQLRIVDRELAMLHAGDPPGVYQVVAEALKAIPGSNPLTLLDMGCASGYYSEVVSTLVGERFAYTGADYSEAMVATARERYPTVQFFTANICDIEVPDNAFDVVLSGAVLQHVEEWEKGLEELIRIAGSYLVLSKTPVWDEPFARTEGELYAGVPGFWNRFNRPDFLGRLAAAGFRVIYERDVYPDRPGKERYMTYTLQAEGTRSASQ